MPVGRTVTRTLEGRLAPEGDPYFSVIDLAALSVRIRQSEGAGGQLCLWIVQVHLDDRGDSRHQVVQIEFDQKW